MNDERVAREVKEFDELVQNAQRVKMKELWEEGDYMGWSAEAGPD